MATREIKFRALEKMEKRMYSPQDLENGNFALGSHGLIVWHEKNNKHLWNVDHRFIPLLYIGLHDKYGKEIYEGDIVRNLNYYFGNSEVRYHNGRFTVYLNDGGFLAENSNNDWFEECEVLGNIYENPELLKGAS